MRSNDHPPAAVPAAAGSAEPSRSLGLQGPSNCRDLGGYATTDGQRVRWRRLLRSDHLGMLTDADAQQLAACGLERVLDFRGLHESGATPNRLQALPGVAEHALVIEPTVVQQMQALSAAGQDLTPATVTRLMQNLYRSLVVEHSERFAAFFQHLLQASGSVLFHCTAGKDRTGLAAAFTLLALGVDEATVMADYLLTNQLYRRPQLPDSQTPAAALAVLWTVQPLFLQTAWAAAQADSGSLDGYLQRRLGIGAPERLALRQRYLTAT